MADTSHKKNHYYAMRQIFACQERTISRKLFHATSEEEDAHLWKKYLELMESWEALERLEGVNVIDNLECMKRRRQKRPVFTGEYVALTLHLRELNIQRSREKDAGRKNELCQEIGKVRAQRRKISRFVSREEIA